jgi:hypothetical protein
MVVRLCLGLLAIASVAPSYQGSASDRKIGDFETFYSSGTLSFTKGSQEWDVHLQDLPIRQTDCEQQCSDVTLPGCAGACFWGVSMLTIDEPRQIAYFAVATGIGQNKPWIFFGYSLKMRRLFRLTNEYGAAPGSAAVSPKGRYLAYVFYPHTPVVCPDISWLGVIDLQERRSTSVKMSEQDDVSGTVTSFRWSTPSTIDFDKQTVALNNCSTAEPRPTPQRETITIDVRQLRFK